jgi:hypothetical protein
MREAYIPYAGFPVPELNQGDIAKQDYCIVEKEQNQH